MADCRAYCSHATMMLWRLHRPRGGGELVSDGGGRGPLKSHCGAAEAPSFEKKRKRRSCATDSHWITRKHTKQDIFNVIVLSLLQFSVYIHWALAPSYSRPGVCFVFFSFLSCFFTVLQKPKPSQDKNTRPVWSHIIARVWKMSTTPLFSLAHGQQL